MKQMLSLSTCSWGL